jgi:hypothetical protein
MPTLRAIEPPAISLPDSYPTLPTSVHHERLARVVERMTSEDLDVLVIYADREHSGNQEFLCGVAPRFEESLLLLSRSGTRILLLGNENQAYAPDPDLQIEVRLFQDFSPLGQRRDDSVPLEAHLGDAGVGPGVRVGCAGWKYLTADLVGDASRAIEIPAFIVDELRRLTGGHEFVTNAGRIFLDNATGLRVAANDVHQIAQFEYAAAVTSTSVWGALRGITVGVRERDLEAHLLSRGLPLSCHNMVSFGDKVRRSLSSPSDKVATLGDPYVIAQGLVGSLTCRAGAVIGGVEDLPPELREFYPQFAGNYFDVIASWYEAVRVGVSAGDVFSAVDSVRDRSLFTFFLTPGHYLSIEEWANSPFHDGDRTELKSGAALQTDIIPVSVGPYCYANIEDGIVLADSALRKELADQYPNVLDRVMARREFMAERIGINLDESVLPLSNTPGLFAPYALNPQLVFTR